MKFDGSLGECREDVMEKNENISSGKMFLLSYVCGSASGLGLGLQILVSFASLVTVLTDLCDLIAGRTEMSLDQDWISVSLLF